MIRIRNPQKSKPESHPQHWRKRKRGLLYRGKTSPLTPARMMGISFALRVKALRKMEKRMRMKLCIHNHPSQQNELIALNSRKM
jgi:hypothetical protein